MVQKQHTYESYQDNQQFLKQFSSWHIKSQSKVEKTSQSKTSKEQHYSAVKQTGRGTNDWKASYNLEIIGILDICLKLIVNNFISSSFVAL
jgi:hypothetical protein